MIAGDHLIRSPHDQVNSKLRPSLNQYLDGLAERLTLERHHHQQVNVGVLGWRAVGVGAEEDDPLGVEAGGDLLGECLYVALFDREEAEVRSWNYTWQTWSVNNDDVQEMKETIKHLLITERLSLRLRRYFLEVIWYSSVCISRIMDLLKYRIVRA